MANTYRVQVNTKTYVPELGCEYSDAQYFIIPADMTLEQFEKEKGDEIAKEESKRIADRIYERENPPVQPEPTEEELVAQKQALQDQLVQLQDQVDEQVIQIDTKLEAIAVAKAIDIKPSPIQPMGDVVI